MATTPKKHVLWQMDLSILDSPYFETAETSVTSSSTLEYVNAQLVAHGFAPSPGLCLDGTSDVDSTRVVKCVLGLLGQRVQDMSRMEDLTVKCRTLTYDLERMRSLHGKEVEKAANAEREMNLHKSRLAASVRSLQATENTQKRTLSELQRTKTLLQGVRATHQAEIKKKEKEVERVLDKWQKLTDSQSKLVVAQSGMRCANAAVVDGAQVVGKGLGFLDIALEQSEEARNHLNNENLMLRKVILKTVNELQSLQHKLRAVLPGDFVLEEASQHTMTTLFVPSTPTAISDKVSGILHSLEEMLSSLETQITVLQSSNRPDSQVSEDEVQRLQNVITKLKDDLAASQKQALAQLKETRNLFDKFAADKRYSTREIDETSVELITVPQRDEEQERIEKLRAELDLERQQFTEATIRLGKEKAELAAERFRLIEAKRSWEVEKMLADLSATPGSLAVSKSNCQSPSPKTSPLKSPHKSPHKSPRKSPAKGIVVRRASGSRACRVSRISLASPGKVVTYETEVPPPVFPPLKSFAPSSSLLPTSFVLPPPSPRASLPTEPILPLSQNGPPIDDRALLSPPTVEVSPPRDNTGINNPITPALIRRPFPVAKPFAQRMVHAYSPARPSPLSRILMLANSPTTPPKGVPETNNSLSPVLDSSEGDSLDSLERAVLGVTTAKSIPSAPALSLEDMGCDSGTESSPQQKNEVRRPRKGPPARGRAFPPEANTKKIKAVERPRSPAVWEKENRNSGKQKVFSKPSSGEGNVVRKVIPSNTSKAPLKPAAKATKTASTVSKEKPLVKPPVPGGPRRVLINSADAPAFGKVWKG